jgi:hypothetical protein
VNDAEARLRAGGAAPADVAEVLALLDEARALAAERWEAIGRLAPAAKAHRDRAQDAVRLLAALRDALRAGSIDEAAWLARIEVMIGAHG